jgi:hypothetical protein
MLQSKIYIFALIFMLAPTALKAQSYYSNLGIYRDIVEQGNKNSSDKFKPKISNRIVIDGDLNRNFKASNDNDEFNNISGKIRFFNNIYFNKNISFNSYLKLQDVKNLNPLTQTSISNNNGKDRYFRDIGLFAEELNFRYHNENQEKKIGNNFILGKFNLGFGSAWRWDRGLWIHSLAETYKQVEKIGIANVLQAGNIKKTGQYNLGFSMFTNDRKNLDNALFSNKHSGSKSLATPGDTRALKSYNLSLDVNFDFDKNEKLNYHFSYLNLAVNGKDSQVNPYKIADQKSFAFGGNYKHPLNDKIYLDNLIEYVKINNFMGDSDRLRGYLTLNSILKYQKNWSLLLGNSRLKDRNLNGLSFNQNLSEISLGYEFDKNNYFDKLTIQLGYRHNRIAFLGHNVQTQSSQGLLIRYYKNF